MSEIHKKYIMLMEDFIKFNEFPLLSEKGLIFILSYKGYS